MRLTHDQTAIIRDTAREVFGADARVWPFGSRVDGRKRGGDIDLYVKLWDNPAREPGGPKGLLKRGLTRSDWCVPPL